MFAQLELQLLAFSHTLPLEWFVFVASIVEEIVAPIPSPTVMVLAGTIATVQGYPLLGLVALACIGAVGKTIGALVVYFVARFGEGVVVNRFGKYFGVSEHDVERLRVRVGTGARGVFVLTLLRALPIMPSVIVSVGAGVLGVPVWMVCVSAFIGTIVRDGVYLYAGYVGTHALTHFVAGSVRIESLIEYAIVSFLLCRAGYLIYRRHVNRKTH